MYKFILLYFFQDSDLEINLLQCMLDGGSFWIFDVAGITSGVLKPVLLPFYVLI